MPYIAQGDKDKWSEEDIANVASKIEHCGELNYILTLMVHNYIKRKGLRYQHINDVIGALEGAKTEFYRRVAAPYEDQKISDNGDVMGIQK